MIMNTNRTLPLLVVACALTLSACVNVKPFHRDVLSKPEMQFDFEKGEQAAREHFLNSLEGSTGGFGTGGGGCGCN